MIFNEEAYVTEWFTEGSSIKVKQKQMKNGLDLKMKVHMGE